MIKRKNTQVKDLMFEGCPLVSVIVPTYNRTQLLRETIESILSQTFDNFELIIVDNVSEDGTEQYVNGLEDPRIRYFRNANNGIIAVNRNVGIQNAKGKYIAFCDDDDLWLPRKLAQQVEFMENNRDVGLCAGYEATIDLKGDLHYFPGKNSLAFRYYDFNNLIKCNHIDCCTAMVRRTCLENIGGFDEDPNLVGIEDYDLWLMIAREYRVARIPFVMAKHRRHLGNTSRDCVEMNLNLLNVLRKYEDMGHVGVKTMNSLKGNVYRKLFVRVCLQRDDRARRYALESIKQSFDVRNYIYYLVSLLPVPWGFYILTLLRRFLMLRGRARIVSQNWGPDLG